MRDPNLDPYVIPGSGEWTVSEGVLGVERVNRAREVPTADQIYRVAIEGESAENVLPPLPTAHVRSFSRYPLSIEIRIEVDERVSATGLRAVVYAVGEKVAIELRDVQSRVADHVVVNEIWHPLALGSLAEARAILTAANVSAEQTLSLRQYLTLLQQARTHPIIRDASGNLGGARRPAFTTCPDAPPEFAGRLYPYQVDGLRWLQLLGSQDLGGILADEMGLGKTVQIAAFLLSARRAHTPSLIVAPGTLLVNWCRELRRFTPSLNVTIHSGADRTGFPDDLKRPDVTVTSYDTLVRDLSLLREIAWNVVVLDEAQAIKNDDTRRSSAAKRLRRRVGIAVTGTPVENRLTDLWSIADFAIPGLLGDIRTFERDHANDSIGARALEPLVSPILLRRRISEVARDLPERIDIPQPLEMSSEQALAYDRVRQEALAKGAGATLASLTLLRMFCAHPSLLAKSAADPCADSAKYCRTVEILEEIVAQGEKALVFTSYNAMTDLLVEDIAERLAISTAFIDGRTPIPERQTMVDTFGSVKGPAVLVLNPRAAGTGLNLTSANHVIHYNLEWNPAVEDQASARAYRRGQTRPVTVHRLFYVQTVEEVIDRRLTTKRQLAQAAVVGTDGSETDLSDIRDALTQSPIHKRETNGL